MRWTDKFRGSLIVDVCAERGVRRGVCAEFFLCETRLRRANTATTTPHKTYVHLHTETLVQTYTLRCIVKVVVVRVPCLESSWPRARLADRHLQTRYLTSCRQKPCRGPFGIDISSCLSETKDDKRQVQNVVGS